MRCNCNQEIWVDAWALPWQTVRNTIEMNCYCHIKRTMENAKWTPFQCFMALYFSDGFFFFSSESEGDPSQYLPNNSFLTHLQSDPIFYLYWHLKRIHDGLQFQRNARQYLSNLMPVTVRWLHSTTIANRTRRLHLMGPQRSITHFISHYAYTLFSTIFHRLVCRIWCALKDCVHYKLQFRPITLI